MNRYIGTRLIDISNIDHRDKMSSTVYKSIPKSTSDVWAMTQSGDRLDSIAFQFYGDSSYWWYIARANGLSTINIEAGVRLRLPPLTNAGVLIDRSISNKGKY